MVAEPLPDASGGNADDAPTVAPASLVGYDVGVADPTRLGRLPAGTPYYQQGDAAVRMQSRKLFRYNNLKQYYGPPTRQVSFIPLVFELTGALGPQAKKVFSGWRKDAAEMVKKAGQGNYRATGRAHTWNAMKFSSLYMQMLSVSIVRDTACAVLRAVGKAVRLCKH